MLDFSWSHILIVLIVALVVVGPKDLPRLMRMVGQWMGKARAMADQFRKSFDEMARQSELDELRKEIKALREQRPLADVQDTCISRSCRRHDLRTGGRMPAPVTGAPEPAETDPATPSA